MAAVRRPIEALDFAREMVKSMPVERLLVRILQDTSTTMWMAAPWRWTIGAFENITVAANTTDINVASPPSDFLYLAKAFLTDNQTTRPVEIEPSLPPTPVRRGTPTKIAYVPGSPNKIRVDPPLGDLASGLTWTLVSWYKKTAPIITREHAYTAGRLVMDDEWFHVFCDGVLYKAYLYADDVRAGQIQVNAQGQIQYTGQLAAFQAGLAEMRRSEPVLDLSIKPPLQDVDKPRG